MKLDRNKQTELAIIGAGIIGITAAYRLRQAGFNVTLYDKDGISEGCSKGNAGHFASEQVFPLAQKSLLPQVPKMLIDPLGPFSVSLSYFPKALPWFIRFLNNMRNKLYNTNKKALKSLNSKAISSWESLLQETELTQLFHQQGSLLVFESPPEVDAIEIQTQYKNEGINVELLNRAALDDLEPGLAKNIKCALFFTDVAHTSCPISLSKALYSKAHELGVKFVQTEIQNIESIADKILLSTKEHTFQADKLLIATGAFSKQLCAQIGFKIPLDTERGYHLMVDTLKQPKRPIVSFEKKFIMTPMTDGLRLAGTVEFAGLKKPMNPKRSDVLLPSGSAIWPTITTTQSSEQEKRWMGFRPSLPDSKPVMGQSPKHKNIYFSFGHQHLGLTLAAISAELITQKISGKKTSISLKQYAIDRF